MPAPTRHVVKPYAAVFVLAFLPYLARCQANQGLAGDTPERRHAAYLQLNRQIYARREDPGSGNLNGSNGNFQAANKQLRKMIAREIQLALSVPRPLAKSITAAITQLQGDTTLSAWGPESTNTPFASFFTLDGIPFAAIAYVVMRGDGATPDTQTYLEFYDKASGGWQERAAASTLADFEGCTFSVAQLSSGVPGEAWFLAWGGPFGSSHGSIKVRLYAFDGAAVRTIWKRDLLDGGKVAGTSDTVTLDCLDRKDPSIEKHEVFHVTPSGLRPDSQSTRSH